ncbi:Aste57867_3595 [Aphanomyces stellatus]|uniref:Aste57867_3595 protein n=1 Tax=Aphanomyces stellatus TaxID=120398 RepID=A0A485KDX4_9STRA|nr:hypothetical protein As57867_003584 [Aphanomyces stellatus]VFT80756.1 Aste57867_3595 [Aphanomyces stellatus]
MAQNAVCPYQDLPSWVTGVQVADISLCGSLVNASSCVVNKSCKFLGVWAPYQAIGSWKDSDRSELTVTANRTTLDFSKLAFSPTMASLTVRNATNFSLPASFQWPTNITSVTFQYMVNFALPSTWPSVLTELWLLNVTLAVFPLNIPQSLKYLYLDNTNLTELTTIQGRNLTTVYGLFQPSNAELINIYMCRTMRNNPKLRRFANLNLTIATCFEVMGMNITSWLMDLSTLDKLNAMPARTNTRIAMGYVTLQRKLWNEYMLEPLIYN